MAKKKTIKKTNWLALIPAFAAIATIILATFLAGVIKVDQATIGSTLLSTTTTTVSLIGLMFGNGTSVSKTVSSNSENITKTPYDGGMSTFGLIAIILLAIGIVAIVASLFIKGKKLDFIGSALILLGGIFIFLVLVGGTDLVSTFEIGSYVQTNTVPFADAFEGFKLGAGVYVCAIISILGGLIGGYTALKAKT